LSGRLALGQKIALERRRGQVASLATHLHAISPLATLERGYAIVTDPEGRAIGSAADVSIGQTASVRLGDGAFKADVTEVTIEKPKD
jgi:exodeoxyribonuclease VII large subunit